MITRNLLAIATTIVLTACGQANFGGGESDSGSDSAKDGETSQTGSEPTTRSFSVVVDAGQQPPACDAAAANSLIYEVASSSFKVCKDGAWAAIDIKGTKGDAGAPGAVGTSGSDGKDGKNGKDGTDNRIIASIGCDGSLENTSLYFSYSAALMKSGDVFASGSVRDGNIEISGTRFFSSQQNGATTASVLFNDDFVAPYNGGFWSIELNRTNLVTTINYIDSDAIGGGSTWTMDPVACVKNEY